MLFPDVFVVSIDLKASLNAATAAQDATPDVINALPTSGRPGGTTDADILNFERRCDRCALAAAKNLVNQVSAAVRSLPRRLQFVWDRTEAQNRVRAVLERGLQLDAGFKENWPEILDTLFETEKKGGSR